MFLLMKFLLQKDVRLSMVNIIPIVRLKKTLHNLGLSISSTF